MKNNYISNFININNTQNISEVFFSGVILAGGKGERLYPLTKDIPKPMVKIGDKPVLEYQIAILKKYHITKIYILLGYLGDVIVDYFGDGSSFGVNITYIKEDKPLGTAGAVKQLEDFIKNDFLLIYGDILFNIKLDDMIDFHKKKNSCATLVAHPTDHPYDSDLLNIDDSSQIINILTKPHNTEFYENENIGNAALYILSPGVFKYIPDIPSKPNIPSKKPYSPTKKNNMTDFIPADFIPADFIPADFIPTDFIPIDFIPIDFMKTVFPSMLKAKEKLYAYKTAEYIKDMGTKERLETVKNDFAKGRVSKQSKELKQSAIFCDRDGTVIKDIGYLHKIEDIEFFSFSASTIKKINNSDYLIFLVTNQSAVARGLCDINTIHRVHNKMVAILGKDNAYFNDIFFCPHHPDKGFPEENSEFKIVCSCRKPEIGMVEKAVALYNIDLSSSWFIGDTTTDIQTGINAGLKTILVKTGYGGRDGKYLVQSDFVFDNLEQGVDFILNISK